MLFATVFSLIFSSCDWIKSIIEPDPVSQYAVGDTLCIHNLPGSDTLTIRASLAIGKEGCIIYAAVGGTVWCKSAMIFSINKEDGSLIWRSEPLDNIGINSQIVVADDGNIYVIGAYRLSII